MTIAMIDQSHAVDATSWLPSANGHPEFPIQNLPMGVFSPIGGMSRGGVAIGDHILDLSGAIGAGLFEGAALAAARAAAGAELNPFLALPTATRRALRHRLFALFDKGARCAERRLVEYHLHPMAYCQLHLPATIGDYTDFYAGIIHAENVGRLLRPDNPLLPNYKHIPIGYHGRASTISASGGTVRRPWGQLFDAGATGPLLRPSQRLDYEVELGIWIAGNNSPGEPVPIDQAGDRIAGLCLLNDWSARDIQAWEYQPLGPFLAKNFATTISPWIVTAEALAPYRIAQRPRAIDDPVPLPYLLDGDDQAKGAFAIGIEVAVQTARMRDVGVAPQRLGSTAASHLYWTPAQLVTHHASGGCNLRPGDLIGTGTISSPSPSGFGSLMELSRGGCDPIVLENGETRRFLEDGDMVVMTGHAAADGFATIGFGSCTATVTPALATP